MTTRTVAFPAAFVAATPRGRIDASGADRIGFLDDVLSQAVARLEVGAAAGALLLDPHGIPLAVLELVMLTDSVALLTPGPDVATDVAVALGARTFLADVRFAVIAVDSIALRGDEARAVAARAGLDAAPGQAHERDGVIAVARLDGLDLVGPRDRLAAVSNLLRQAGATDETSSALEAWRIARGEPAWGREVVAPHLPEEAGLLPTHVHLDKGCYPGQEAVARMWNLGRPRRRLAKVELHGAATEGWRFGAGKGGVAVTSAARIGDDHVGLAYVPTAAEAGQRIGDDAAAVVVTGFVGAELDVPGHDPTHVRRRDRLSRSAEGR